MYCKFSARVQNVIQIFAVQIKLINIVSEKKCILFLRVSFPIRVSQVLVHTLYPIVYSNEPI